MADKQASVYVVDVSASMGKNHNNRNESDLSYALHYVWDKITTTVSNGRKTEVIGVVGLRTNGTNNELQKDEAYEHISVLTPLQQFLMPHLRDLDGELKPSRTEEGDGISALVVAIQMVTTFCRKLKYIKNIYFLTNGRGSFDPDGMEEIAGQLKAENINLTILGVDFDDPDYGFKEEGKEEKKAENEETLKKLCELSDGTFGTLEEAVNELGRPRLKTVRPIASYKGKLSLGDPDTYQTALAIDVERYPRVMVAKPVSASRYVDAPARSQHENGQGSSVQLEDRGSKGLQAVKMVRAYQVNDDSEASGKKDIDREELEKGYKYGRTVVAISATDEGVTTMSTEPGMEIVGYIASEKVDEPWWVPEIDAYVVQYKRYFSMSNTNVIIAQKGNDTAALALSSLIHALYELESYALVRFVKKKDDAPVMMALAPYIDADYECLIDVQLPFIEDVRPYKFPPLGTVKTVTGKPLEKHRNIPTEEMDKLMSDYVDAMDLSAYEKDDDGDLDYAPVEDTFSPVLHRINQVIRYRALHPNDPLPPPYEILLKYSKPPQDLLEKAQLTIDKLKAACDVKKVETKAKGKRTRDQPKPKSGLDIEGLLSIDPAQTKKIKISTDNPIPDFKHKLAASEDESEIQEATKQMLVIVKDVISNSFSDLNYQQACELLGCMRENLLEYEFADMYNEAIKELKKNIVEGKLRGDRTKMLEHMKKDRLGLLTAADAADASQVTEEEAKEFWNTTK